MRKNKEDQSTKPNVEHDEERYQELNEQTRSTMNSMQPPEEQIGGDRDAHEVKEHAGKGITMPDTSKRDLR